ncbi:hypothetical protein [Ferruginibacter profundus]
MNLTGHWKGQYTYGKEYGKLWGTSEPFEFDIVDQSGHISGSCIDNLVKAKAGNESYILGNFSGKEITFKKRYKYHLMIDDSNNLLNNVDFVSDGVDYTGRLKVKFFSRKLFFSGKWSITERFKDEDNMDQIFICTGTWTMMKVS